MKPSISSCSIPATAANAILTIDGWLYIYSDPSAPPHALRASLVTRLHAPGARGINAYHGEKIAPVGANAIDSHG